MAEKTRYSDEELQEFKEIIEEKLAVAKADYQRMMRTLMNEDGNDVDDTSPTYKVLEEGSATQTKEELMTQAARIQKFIQGLDARPYSEQDLRHRPHYWRADTQGATPCRSACYAECTK